MTTRVAVVGLGKMGLLHASVLSMLDGVVLVAVVEKSPFIRNFGKKALPGVSVVSDLKELSGMELDAVCVTTPPATHFPIIKTIYVEEIANNVLSEKPLASTYAQAEELCRLASTYGGVNMVGYHRRFSVAMRKAKQIVDDGALGELSSFEGYAYSADFVGATSAQSLARGGVVEDSAVHVVDLALWFFGQMGVRDAKTESLLGDGTEDEAYFKVQTSTGLEGKFWASWCKDGYRLPEMGLTVFGSEGTLKVNEDRVELKLRSGDSQLWYKHDLDDTVPFFIGGAEYQRQDELFVQSIQTGSSAEPSFQTASKVEEFIDQVNNCAAGVMVR